MKRSESLAWWRPISPPLSLVVGLLLSICCVASAQGANEQVSAAPSGSVEFELADVIVDGRLIMKVRGTESFPAARRAAEIERNIVDAARDDSIPADAVTIKVEGDSTLARKQGLILHTTVGIGYETPWRQVEAMLKLAANRTPGLLEKPEPFVFRKELGDFGVAHEINAYCREPEKIAQIYSTLHDNILDVFNEYGVAIMAPAYEADTPEPKLVPKDQWYAAPATRPSESGSK